MARADGVPDFLETKSHVVKALKNTAASAKPGADSPLLTTHHPSLWRYDMLTDIHPINYGAITEMEESLALKEYNDNTVKSTGMESFHLNRDSSSI